MYTCISMYIYICICTYTYVYVRIHMYIWIYIYICICICMYICVFTYVYVCNSCIYSHTHSLFFVLIYLHFSPYLSCHCTHSLYPEFSLSQTHTHTLSNTHTLTHPRAYLFMKQTCILLWNTDGAQTSLRVMSRTSHVTYESCHVRVMSSKSRITYNICNLVMTVHRRLCESCHVWVMSRMSHVTYITYMQFSHVKCESCHSWRNMWHNKQKWAIQRHIQMSHLCVCHRSSITQK